MQNIEVKTPLADRARTERRLTALGARRLWVRAQRDTFFLVPEGWLKVREAEGRRPEIISYRRWGGESGPRTSDYDVIVVEDGGAWRRLLGRVLPVDKVVEKERTLWLHESTRIHLDRIDGLGEFLELETVVKDMDLASARAETLRLMEALALDPAAFIDRPYRDLVR